jgi:tetratricopeptide (TPR) repeat protein
MAISRSFHRVIPFLQMLGWKERVKVRRAVWTKDRMIRAVLACVFCTAALWFTSAVQAQTEEQNVQHVIRLLRMHEYHQSLAGLDKMLASTPHDCRLLSLRGIALNGLQRPVEAVESFQAALAYCPDNLLALEGAAQIEYARHQPDAVKLLDQILKLQPDAIPAHAMLASIYRARGECAKALPHFAASSELFAQKPKYQQAYAYCLADTGHYKQAAEKYGQLLDRDPDEAVRYNFALVQWKLHDPRAALAALQPLLANSKQEAVLTLGARVAEETGDTPMAVKLLRAAIIQQPKNLANYLEFAQIAFNHKSAQVGIDMVNAGLMQLPHAAQLYLARGVLEVQMSKFDAAIEDFETAHKLAPQLSLAMDAMGIMESQQYKQTAALDLYRKEAKLHPKDSLLQYLYAEALSESDSTSNTTSEAIAAAQQSVAIEPNYAPARDLLALLYLRMNNPRKALAEAQAALKMNPTDDVALYHEIMARRRLGQTAEVKILVKKLAVMRKENTQRQRAGHRYVLKDEMAH